MISDLGTYCSARVPVKRYGEDAGFEAAKRVDAMLEAGDIQELVVPFRLGTHLQGIR